MGKPFIIVCFFIHENPVILSKFFLMRLPCHGDIHLRIMKILILAPHETLGVSLANSMSEKESGSCSSRLPEYNGS